MARSITGEVDVPGTFNTYPERWHKIQRCATIVPDEALESLERCSELFMEDSIALDGWYRLFTPQHWLSNSEDRPLQAVPVLLRDFDTPVLKSY